MYFFNSLKLNFQAGSHLNTILLTWFVSNDWHFNWRCHSITKYAQQPFVLFIYCLIGACFGSCSWNHLLIPHYYFSILIAQYTIVDSCVKELLKIVCCRTVHIRLLSTNSLWFCSKRKVEKNKIMIFFVVSRNARLIETKQTFVLITQGVKRRKLSFKISGL